MMPSPIGTQLLLTLTICGVSLLGKQGILLSIIIVWWMTWLYIVSISPTGLFIPSGYTFVLIYSFLGAAFFGGMLAKILSNKIAVQREIETDALEINSDMRADSILKKILLWYCLPLLVLILIRASPYIYNGASYRAEMYGGEMSSVVFGSSYALLAYILFVKPFIVVGMLFGIAQISKNRNFSLLFLSVTLLILDSIIFLSRNQIVEFIVSGFIFVVVGVCIFKLRLRNGIKILGAFLTMIFVIVLNSIIRGQGSSFLDTLKILRDGCIHNFSVGLVILSMELSNPGSAINNISTYGFAIFERACEYLFIYLRRIMTVPDLHKISGNTLKDWRIIGSYNGEDIGGNAYATVFYNLMSDGGISLGLIASLLYGFFLVFKTPSCYRSTKDAIIVLILLGIGVSGVTITTAPVLSFLYFGMYLILRKRYACWIHKKT